MFKKLFVSIVIVMFANVSIEAQVTVPPSVKTPGAVLQDFMDKRFGMFIHWGPVTLRGTEIGWSRDKQVAKEDYDNLYKEFNPVLFNADEWVKAAKDAGMKYLTITARHHDGFCLWPTAYTDYNIMNSPYKKDIVGALDKACKKQGIKFCIYYSVLDWHHPDYPIHSAHDKRVDSMSDMSRYITYMKNQLKELITKYDPYMLWFDGQWESPWTDEMGKDIYTYLKKLKPGVIINNRLGKEMAAVANKAIDVSKMVGDYDTPEQSVGRVNMETPWESCFTICKQWAWKPNDEMKSLEQCLTILSRSAGGNGNLLLNVGPMPDGRIEKRQIDRLKQIGDWLTANGAAIYGTRGGPYKPDSIFSSTRKANKLFIHLYSNKNKGLIIPAIPGIKPLKAYFLDGGDIISCSQSGNSISLSWNINMPDPVCNVLVVEMDNSIDAVPIINKDN